MNSKKAKTVFKDESSMTINNEKATMIGKIDHNEEAGTIKITYTLTTRHLSFNQDVSGQVEAELQKFHKHVYSDALNVRKKWIEDQNKIEGASQIPFPGTEDEDPDFDKFPFGDEDEDEDGSAGEQAVEDVKYHELKSAKVPSRGGSRMKVK